MKAPRGPDGQPTFGFLPSPPPLPRIAARALISCALAQRVELEPADHAVVDAQTLEGLNELLELSFDWLHQQGLDAELSGSERAALQQPAGTLGEALREHFEHRAEAAAVIAWALRRAPIPAFDVDADAAEIAAALGWLDDAGTTLGSTARLRSREEVGAYLDAVSAVHWRLRQQARSARLIDADARDEDGPVGVSLARWRPDRHAWPEDVTPLQLAADDDLALQGRSLAEASAQQLLAAWQRVRERHHATLWLLGQQRDYDAIEINP